MTDHCPICDRASCPRRRRRFCDSPECTPSRRFVGGKGLHRCAEQGEAENDCRAHAVDWRARALAAEAVVESVRVACEPRTTEYVEDLEVIWQINDENANRAEIAALLPPKEEL